MEDNEKMKKCIDQLNSLSHFIYDTYNNDSISDDIESLIGKCDLEIERLKDKKASLEKSNSIDTEETEDSKLVKKLYNSLCREYSYYPLKYKCYLDQIDELKMTLYRRYREIKELKREIEFIENRKSIDSIMTHVNSLYKEIK